MKVFFFFTFRYTISEDMNLIILGSEEENLVTISFLGEIPIKRKGMKCGKLVIYIQWSQNDFAAKTFSVRFTLVISFHS